MISNEDFPYIPPALLLALDDRFPERTPDLHESIDQIRHNAGARSVLRFLHSISEDQQEQLVQVEGSTEALDVGRKVLSGDELLNHVALRVVSGG